MISTSSLSYAGFFTLLPGGALVRICVPHADPYLLPIAALLTAIGVMEIYRLNPTTRSGRGSGS